MDVAEEMLKKADEMMKERDRENAWLNDMLSQHVEKIQVKHGLNGPRDSNDNQSLFYVNLNLKNGQIC